MDHEHFCILRKGVPIWDEWREQNPENIPDLSEADLSEADLSWADLSGADLREANLRCANLSGANLSRANLDFSGWPLWCGSFNVKIDKRIAAQLAYHFCRVICDEQEVQAAQKALWPLANQFHRIGEHNIYKLGE